MISWLWKQVRVFFLHNYDRLCRWLSYRKVCFHVYDFDWISIIKVEAYQLKRIRDCLKKDNLYFGVDRDVERMDLMLRLLDIISTEKSPTYINERNASRFNKHIAEKLKEKSYCGKENALHYLYNDKAWYIYHELRTQWLRNFWD